jgi:hypothetical protein
MKNKPLCYFAISLVSGLTSLMALEVSVLAPAAEAGCRPSGRYAGGLPILNCSGSTRCRPTGRYRTINGRRYPLLRCPR